VALAQDLQVQREHQRRAAGGLGAVDQALDEVAVAHHIELEPERVPACWATSSMEQMLMVDSVNGMPNFLGRARGQDFAIGMLHAGQARGRNGHRHGHVLADHGGARAAVFHVHGHALAQLDALEVGLVGAVGALGPRARVGIVVEHARHAALLASTRRSSMLVIHHGGPDGRGAAGAAHIVHGRAAGVAHPHAHGVALRPAHRPVVAHVLAGAGFHGAPEARGQHAVGAKGARAGVAVGQDVAHDEGRARIQRRG
jgi:hypothetical protein